MDMHLVAVGACVMLMVGALSLTIAFLGSLSRQRIEAIGALALSWFATVPEITQLVTIVEQDGSPFELRIGYFWVGLLWYLCGPLLIAVSTTLSPPRDSPRLLNLARAAHLAAWCCSTWFTLSWALV
jgi:hypothetical protein